MATRLDHFVNARPSRQWLLHALGLYRAITQTSQEERDALVRHASGKSCLAEIGVFQGRTTGGLAEVMDPKGVYYAIDPYPGGGRTGVDYNFLIARREVKRRAAGQVEWVQTTGAEAPNDPRLDGKQVDFLFIDGDHRYEGLKSDWDAWRDLVAPGGIVGLHDTIGGRFGCQTYMQEVIVPDPDFERIEEVHSLTIFRRV
ncbi:MAG: hypothetical protein Rubg2KO_14210 [Rubricoccaceae bacterium]